MDRQAVPGKEPAGPEAFADAFGDGNRPFPTSVGQNQRKFITAEARDHVRFPGASPNHCRRLHERLAAGEVTVVVVDLFEAVEVEKQQRQWAPAARSTLRFAAE